VDVAAAGLRSAEYAQRYGRIVAAADGVVLARLAEPGEVVAAGSPVLRVAAGGGWLLPVELADREGALIGEGDAAEVELDVLPGRRLPARVARIGGEASARSGALRIELRIEAGDALPREIAARLRSGMVGKAWLPLRGESATYVPVSALVEADLGRGVVFVAEPDAAGLLRARRREVRLGALAGSRSGLPPGLVEVTEGLTPRTRVVVAGAAYLQDRDPLRVASRQAVAGSGSDIAPARPVAANR
jgi:RND family efflux transporter MFP subunit